MPGIGSGYGDGSAPRSPAAATAALAKHPLWVEQLKRKYTFTENALDILLRETGKVYVAVLVDAGVCKNTSQREEAFPAFAEHVNRI